MNDLWKHDDFCQDLTRELLSDHDLVRLREQTLARARRVRALRQVRTGLLIVALPVLAWQAMKTPQIPQVVDIPKPIKVEPAYSLLRTEQFTGIIRSEALSSRNLVAGFEPAPLLLTPPEPTFKAITDEQLLSFFEGRPVALVRVPGKGMELEFLEKDEPEQGDRK